MKNIRNKTNVQLKWLSFTLIIAGYLTFQIFRWYTSLIFFFSFMMCNDFKCVLGLFEFGLEKQCKLYNCHCNRFKYVLCTEVKTQWNTAKLVMLIKDKTWAVVIFISVKGFVTVVTWGFWKHAMFVFMSQFSFCLC